MKITKRQLRYLIREAIQGHVHGDPSKPKFLDLVMDAMRKSDYRRAANSIMDSYMIDDVFPEEEDALIDMLAATPAGVSASEVEAIADNWTQMKRTGQLLPEAIAGSNERIAGAASAAISPEAWAAKKGLVVDTDNTGQKIIALTQEEAERYSLPPGVNWEVEQDHDGWTIYTNDYVEEA